MYSLKKRLTFMFFGLILGIMTFTGSYPFEANQSYVGSQETAIASREHHRHHHHRHHHFNNLGYGLGTSVTGVPRYYDASRLYHYGLRDPYFLSGGSTFRTYNRTSPYYYNTFSYPSYYNTFSYPSLYDINRLTSPYYYNTTPKYYYYQTQPLYDTYYIIVPVND